MVIRQPRPALTKLSSVAESEIEGLKHGRHRADSTEPKSVSQKYKAVSAYSFMWLIKCIHRSFDANKL